MKVMMLCNPNECTGCWACVSACAQNCLTMQANDEGHLVPIIDENRCTNCLACSKVCPVLHLPASDHQENPDVYAVFNRDRHIRDESTSGGAFSAFAEEILSRGGVVFGAAYDENLKVSHIAVSSVDNLKKLRVSKYVQSEIGETFRQTRDLLQNTEKPVLFSGTPCQIAGLLSYLGKLGSSPNLYTIDLVCYGVPPAEIFQKYMDFIHRKHGSPIAGFSFRDKRDGWRNSATNITFANGKEIHAYDGDEATFKEAYYKRLMMRNSCHNCRFSKLPRLSDITIGDFWSIGKECPFHHDTTGGITLTMVHSAKGQLLFEESGQRIHFEKRSLEEALAGGEMICGSAKENPLRKQFLIDARNMPFELLIKKYMNKRPHGTRWLLRKLLGSRNYFRIKNRLVK